MPPRNSTTTTPACYALTTPGLEGLAAAEIRDRLGGEILKSTSGMVVFRVEDIDSRLLDLNTVEGEEHGLSDVWVNQEEHHDHGGDELSSEFL
jgi:hypothetical protein